MDTPRTVLVLQSDYLYWFQLLHNTITSVHVQMLSAGSADSATLPPWFSGTDTGQPYWVDLVLDTTLDEVDRVGVDQSDKPLINRYRQMRTLLRLRRDYEQASVYPLPMDYQAQVAGLMHVMIPESWNDCLLALQNAGVVFHRVSTATELVAEWSRQFDSRMLCVMQVAGYQRHVLTDRGVVVFLRTVKLTSQQPGISADTAAIAQTLDYIGSHIPLNRKTQIVLEPGVSQHQCKANTGKQADDTAIVLLPVSTSTSDSYSPDSLPPDSVRCLLCMLMKQPVAYKSTEWCIGVSQQVDSVPISHPVVLADVGNHLMGEKRRWFFKSGNSPADRNDSNCQMALLHSSASSMSVLSPSVSYLKSCLRIRYAFRLSIMVAALAGCMVLAASAKSLTTVRLIQKQGQERSTTQQTVQDRHVDALALHRQPDMAAEALLLADSLSRSDGMTPEMLLESLGVAVTNEPDIDLHSIIWTPVDFDDVYDSLAYALDSVPPRNQHDDLSNNVVQQIELTGAVRGNSLQEQRYLLDRFADALKLMPGAVEVRILESPVDTALSSQSVITDTARYRLSLQLGAVR